jgi:hypothetical protein
MIGLDAVWNLTQCQWALGTLYFKWFFMLYWTLIDTTLSKCPATDWKLRFYHTKLKLSFLFLEVVDLLYLFPRECLTNIHLYIAIICLQSFFQLTWWPWTKLSAQCETHCKTSWDNHWISACGRSAHRHYEGHPQCWDLVKWWRSLLHRKVP